MLLADVWVQRARLSLAEAARAIRPLRAHVTIPEPMRTAHLVAAAIARGASRGRA